MFQWFQCKAGFVKERENNTEVCMLSTTKDDPLYATDVDTKKVAQEIHLALATGKTTIKVSS